MLYKTSNYRAESVLIVSSVREGANGLVGLLCTWDGPWRTSFEAAIQNIENNTDTMRAALKSKRENEKQEIQEMENEAKDVG